MKVVIEGKPISASRPRVTKHGTYNPKKKEQERISFEIKSQLPTNYIPSIKPIELSLLFFMPIPSKLSKKKKTLLIGQPCIKRPDIDNFIIILLNAMNGIVYKDDCQVYEINTSKVYSDNPGTAIFILEYDDCDDDE